jgi:hypothetical protein
MNAVPFSRHMLFWFGLLAIFIGGGIFTYNYFPETFPIVNLTMKMDRQTALGQAQELALKYSWGPQDFEQAASFSVEEETKNFIELEGGGKQKFNEMLKKKVYSPYTWNVRHFKEHDANETMIRFTPEGKPYGFNEKIPENQSGAALTTEQAQQIAEQVATKNWHINFAKYKLEESSQETKPNNRIDHTFVYERTDKTVGEAPYRLRLIVTGNKVTELTRYIKVPEAFKRRYEQMRSANNTIASIASVLAILLYFIGGCILGLLYLMRKRWVLWRTPFLWSTFIALLLVIAKINALPLYWMEYDTALAKRTMYLNFFTSLLMIFGAISIAYGLIFAAAESLTRKAFGDQLQLWRLWSQDGAATIQTLGRTIGGYLIVGFDLTYVVAFYYAALKYFGWWEPSSSLIEPDVLATYLPWLGSIAQALSAGFMEECAFRAIPLSVAALIGKKRGNKTGWLIAGFILQAIIFSAAHANYPAQPAYARLIELMIPSFVFGGIYLIFGLLPGIISHFTYDAILMGLPIFLSHSPGIWLDKLLVILFTLTPLWVILRARLGSSGWQEISKQLYNSAWQPPIAPTKPPAEPLEPELITPKKKFNKLLIVGGLIGLACWLFTAQFTYDGLRISATKALAKTQAAQALKERNIILEKPWQQFSFITGSIDEQQRFVWRTARNLYKKLLGIYLNPAQWQVRYAQFEGNIVQRAEEYNVFINPDGTLRRIAHQLPESLEGRTLSEAEARKIAYAALKKEFNLNPANVSEISAVSTKHPNRLDWLFTFNNPTAYPKKENQKNESGEARIAIQIAGDQVVDYYRYVFVPEEWQRTYREQQTILNLITMICGLLLSLLLAIGGIQAITNIIHHQFATRTFIIFFCILLGKSLIQIVNLFSVIIAAFKTSEPVTNQLLMTFSTLILQILVKSAGFALLASFIQNAIFRFQTKQSIVMRLFIGSGIGTLLAGISALTQYFSPKFKPYWPDYSHASAMFPSISIALTTLTTFIASTITYYLMFKAIDYITNGWQKRYALATVFALLLGIVAKGTSGVEHVPSWLLGGSVFGLLLLLLYIWALCYDRSLIPIGIGTFIILNTAEQFISNPYPGAIIGLVLSIAIIVPFAWWWSNCLYKLSAK